MTSTRFSGYQCWQDARLGTVFNLDAIAIDPVNFLATHAPLNRIQYVGRSRESLDNTGEEQLLAELQRLARKQEHAFVVVEGMPGSGKSHLIRWLKEQYARHRDPLESRDVVLLIERANSSLRGTLRQIIESNELQETGIYGERALAEQLDRLRHAADLLSEEALGDSLLNALQVATTEVKIPDEPGSEALLQNGAAGNLLLDQTFRQFLKRPDGPIDRLTRHLAEGRATQQAADLLPGFTPDDLMLGVDELRRLERVIYQEVRVLATKLANVHQPRMRNHYAEFLNRRLNFAVGQATSLSADDIKQLFNDLRRSLRQRNYQLVLFIEDVTSFTGIDAGLIDVLATQHTGQENSNFALLISVVGITDDYYLSRFPQNLKQRVTHHLRLSSEDNTTVLLESPESIANLASRYLNATRLPETELLQWTASGASPHVLPNACTACPFRSECHDSFGYVAVGEQDDESLHIGLYPFNQLALTTMFKGLNAPYRSPRALLTDVVEEVLVRHGSKVRLGKFPPPRGGLGTEFTPPTLLATGGHDRIIRTEAPHDSERLESLIVVWGDRTVNSKVVDGKRSVGSLPEGVFRAFKLPFIRGIEGGSPPPVSPPDRKTTDETSTRQMTPPPVKEDPILRDIRDWRAGQPLQMYEALRGDLVAFVKDAIDWESYQLSPLQIGERTQARRFRIEGQSGRTTGDVLELPRSDELQYALQAVHALKAMSSLSRADLAGYLLALRAWLDLAEPDIVEFVRKPLSDAPADLQLTEVVIADGLLLASLEGHLVVEQQGAEALGRILLQRGTAALASSAEQFVSTWRGHAETATQFRSKDWTALRRKISADRSYTVWRALVESLSRAQGGATSVRFVDADLLLTGIERFKKSGWNLDRFEYTIDPKSVSTAWEQPLRVLADLREAYPVVLVAERQFLRDLQSRLLGYLDGDSGGEVLETIRTMLQAMRKDNLSQPIDRVMLTGSAIDSQLARLKNLVEEHETARSAVRLSNADQTAKQVLESITFFGQVESILARYEPLIDGQYKTNQQQMDALHSADVVRAEVKELVRIIDGALRVASSVGGE